MRKMLWLVTLLPLVALGQVGSPIPTTSFTRGFLRTTNGLQAAQTLGFSTNGMVGTNIAVTVSNQVTVSVTNLGAAEVGIIYVDALAGNPTNNGTAMFPLDTLSNAQSRAVSGQTIYGVRGTFAETYLGKPGVNWYFNKGVLLFGGGSWPVFWVTNSDTELSVDGYATCSNEVVYVDTATNSRINIKLDKWTPATSKSLIAMGEFALSNTIQIVVSQTSGKAGVTLLSENAGLTNRVNWTTIVCPEILICNPGTIKSSNTVLTIKSGQWRCAANGGLGTLGTLRVEGGQFSRGGSLQNSVGANVWFKGVSCTSSNTDASAAIYTGVRGTFYFENERTLINNP